MYSPWSQMARIVHRTTLCYSTLHTLLPSLNVKPRALTRQTNMPAITELESSDVRVMNKSFRNEQLGSPRLH